MTTIGMRFAHELEGELSLCRQILERIPPHLLDWKPHPKSPSMGELSVHLADMIDWIKLAATTSELDYATKPHEHSTPASTSALLAYFDERAHGTIESVRHVSDEEMHKPWTVRNGERIFFSRPRVEVIRVDCLNHIIHHRGQLTVYCRLKDIALPGVYGPNGDE
ncbi:MAG: DinB family protein [Caldilineaceae bacterium]|nr:DinB family protein [Caldilineaceae bacterium]